MKKGLLPVCSAYAPGDVGAGAVLPFESFSVAIVDTFSPVPLLPGETVILIVLDTLHLAAGAAGGWLALRS